MSSFPGGVGFAGRRPVSARSGKKRVHQPINGAADSGGRGPSRGHGSALVRSARE